MSESLTLQSGQLQVAMKVLDRELAEHLPTRRELRWYRAFKWGTLLLLVQLMLVAVAELFKPLQGLSEALEGEWSGYLLATVAIGSGVVFLLNHSLIRKLWHNQVLRRRLGLERDLRPVFKIREGRWRRVLDGVCRFTLGLVFTLFLLFFLWDLLSDPRDQVEIWGSPLRVLIAGLTFAFIPLGLIGGWYMKEARERLNIVTGLQDLLRSSEREADAGSTGPVIPTTAAQVIARIERSRIIGERRQSLKSSVKAARRLGYSVQESNAVQLAKVELDPLAVRKVEQRLVELMENPRPETMRQDEETGMSILEVPGTGHEIGYQIQDELSLVKVFFLKSSRERAG